VCYNPINFPFQGRKNAIESFMDYIENRKKARDSVIPTLQGDRHLNSLCVTQAAPGAGKSYFCDILASHDEQFIKDHTKEGSYARTFLESSIGLSVSYNGNTPFHQGLDDQTAVGGLVARILWR
jgi:hypothetical protein